MGVRLTRIYTRTGDSGSTALIGGRRVSKGSIQMECIGAVDELNALLGIIRTVSEASSLAVVADAAETTFKRIQNKLFDIGSILAMDSERSMDCKFTVSEADVATVEATIDSWNASLAPLDSFTLPGGCILNAHAHHARTVCRRVERNLVRLHDVIPVDTRVLQYINRLSDLLFVYSRWASQQLGAAEYLWEYG